MTDNQQSWALTPSPSPAEAGEGKFRPALMRRIKDSLTPNPSPAAAGEGSIVTEMAVNHFRRIH
jgi:hypothetical protein